MCSLLVETLSDASGAVQAAVKGHVIVVVDVIDMSTTLEAVLEAGALAVFGASPDHARVPVFINPEKVGYFAGSLARMHGTGLIIVAEPRVGSDKERLQRVSQALTGVKLAGVSKIAIVPNWGTETVKAAEFKNKVVLAVTGSGGVAFDAAFNAGGTITTATVARTQMMKGIHPAMSGVQRAINIARIKSSGISVVAASSNSLEDVLAARFIADCIQLMQFTDFNHNSLCQT